MPTTPATPPSDPSGPSATPEQPQAPARSPEILRVIDGTLVSSRFTTPAQELAAIRAADLERLGRRAAEIEKSHRSPNTRRVYESHWRQFVAWCERMDLCPLPAAPQTLRLYLTDLAEQRKPARQAKQRTRSGGTKTVQVPGGEYRYKVSSLRAHLSAISRAHFESGHPHDVTRSAPVVVLMESLARERAEAPKRRKPLLRDDIVTLVDSMDHSTWPAGVAAARDTFAILFGFASALRREEQAALSHGDVILAPPDGLHVRLGVTKTDQTGEGALIAVPYGKAKIKEPDTNRLLDDCRTCPLCAYARWVRLAHAWDTGGRGAAMRLVFETPPPEQWTTHVCRGFIPTLPPEQPLFRRIAKSGAIADAESGPITGQALYDMLKKRLLAAGYDPTTFGMHSLRAGFVTQARRNGVPSRNVRKQTRHSSDAMVDLYDRDGAPLRDNAVTDIGL